MGFSKLAESSSELTENLRHATNAELPGFKEAYEKVKTDYTTVIEKIKQI